jgi:signal transduction histidine kinase/ActR/RegA family two-component response regulator
MTKAKAAKGRRGEKNGVSGLGVLERRVLIVAPTGNDAILTANFLEEADLATKVCVNVAQLAEEVNKGCGALILAEEILGQESISILIQALAEQPVWSDIPIILITSGGEVSQTQLRQLAVFGPGGNVTLLERPFRPITLLSALEVALRSRQRQYEARESVQQLKRAHDEIQSSSRAKDDFLAALSHELRTPLNPVLLVASEHAGNGTLPAPIRADFEMIRKNVELEARLIDDLLDLTRISRGKLSLNKQPASLHEILQDALAKIAGDIEQKQLKLQVKLAAHHDTVLGDTARLQQVFWNVLKNAVKFTPAGGQITVKTSALNSNGKFVVKITDTGIGMSPKEIGRIFNAFSQGDHAAQGGSHRFGGLGLGLAISHSLISLHHGLIFATSAGPGKGSSFTIELPLEPAGHKSGEAHDANLDIHAAPVTASPEKARRVLLVEDHEPTRIALANLLTRRHYDVRPAGTLKNAYELAAQEKFDLVISDIGLPDGTGYELISKLKAKFGLRGIALTGYGMEQDITRAKDAGFVAHLIKPVRIDALEKILSEVCAESPTEAK